MTDLNILSIENPVESEVLLTTEESSTWLLDSGVSYHVTPHRYQFRQYVEITSSTSAESAEEAEDRRLKKPRTESVGTDR